MPNVVCLTSKSNPELNTEADKKLWFKIDEDICAMLGVPVDPVKWCFGWYDIIGFRLALKADINRVIVEFNTYIAKAAYKRDYEQMEFDRTIRKIAQYLADNYTVDAWYQTKH